MPGHEQESRTVTVLDQIPAELTVENVLGAMRVRKVTPSLTRLTESLIDEATPVARPKAMYTLCYVDHASDRSVVLEGYEFTSTVLRRLLDGIGRAFPFVATCGVEVDAIETPKGDLMAAYCLDSIKMVLVQTARRYAERHIRDTYSLSPLSRMVPGSHEDWPLQEQRPLFDLLGEVEERIGVHLTDKFLMIPIKSVSGIFFPTEVRFEHCQLCTRARCPGRRAPYDPHVAARYGV